MPAGSDDGARNCSKRSLVRVMGALLGLAVSGGITAQTVNLDNAQPIPLTTSASLSALRLDPQSGNVTVRSQAGNFATCVGSGALPAADKSLLAGSTRLAINNSGPINLLGSVPIDFLNRSVANGRRVLQLRVGQPLLCADFAPAPGGAANPVALQFADPNGDTSPLLFGGIASTAYLTNGTSPSLLRVVSGAELACCTMLPAANASCYQGTAGGAGGDALFANGFENGVDAPPGGAADLRVTMNGPLTVASGNNYVYSITVANDGGSAINGVRVRDWFPKASGGFPASLSAGSWNCVPAAGSFCGSSSGNGNLVLDAVGLAANSSVTINLVRQLAGGVPDGVQFSVSAAAFAPPSTAEGNLANNQAALTASVQSGTSLSISDLTATEGNSGITNFSFIVTRSSTAGAVSVLVSTANGSATAGSDYTAINNQTVNFSAGGSSTAVVNVSVNGDSVLEANETFSVNLASPSGATIADGQAVGTINNDDSASVAINDVTIAEGNSGTTIAAFTVTLSGAVQGGFTVLPATANFTATAPSDYATYSGGALAFAGTPGETRQVAVQVNGDNILEGNETFFVNPAPPSNPAVSLSDAQGIGTINNDDTASLSINDVNVVEGNAGTVSATFTIALNGAVQGGFEVPVSSADVTATIANNDYLAIPGGTTSAFTGTPGETRTITVLVNGDTAVEPTEFFTVNLGAPGIPALVISDGQGVGAINNDDAAD